MLLFALSLAASFHPHDAACDCEGRGPAGAQPVLRSGAITNQDYPASALREGAEGTVRFRLDVGADGRVTGCAIQASSGSSALDSTACSLARRRFRFTPARDSEGRPVPGQVTRSVNWTLPEAAPVVDFPPPEKKPGG